MKDWAIIFDVDGVLLELTREEEELFFQPFASRLDASKLSRDWNSYKIRNDEDIVREIVERHHLPLPEAETIAAEYLALLERKLKANLKSVPIIGGPAMLKELVPRARLGVATANFRKAAELRLSQVDMWEDVSSLAFGADGGGHKAAILARAIAASGLPQSRIIFIGDNVSDVQAGLENNVHFIGFSTDDLRRKNLVAAGAQKTAANHTQTLEAISHILGA